jgi:hypothetical protein
MNATILAALAGLLGLAAGRLWDARTEATRWRRDQRIRIYESLASGYYQVREAIRVLAMSEPNTNESEAAEIRVLEVAANDWNRQVVAAWLHGSAPVIAKVENLDRRIVELFFRARARRFTWQEFQGARETTQEAIEQYIETIRKELKQPSLKVTIHYAQPGMPSQDVSGQTNVE